MAEAAAHTAAGSGLYQGGWWSPAPLLPCRRCCGPSRAGSAPPPPCRSLARVVCAGPLSGRHLYYGRGEAARAASGAFVLIGPFRRRCPLAAAAALPASSGPPLPFPVGHLPWREVSRGAAAAGGTQSAAIRAPGAVSRAGLCSGAARSPAQGLRAGPGPGGALIGSRPEHGLGPGRAGGSGLGDDHGLAWVARGRGKGPGPVHRGRSCSPGARAGPAAAFIRARVHRPQQPWRPAAMA